MGGWQGLVSLLVLFLFQCSVACCVFGVSIADNGALRRYVGIEKGIFELTLDFNDRKFWPALDMR